jgi:hypothetical protein
LRKIIDIDNYKKQKDIEYWHKLQIKVKKLIQEAQVKPALDKLIK